MIQDIAETIDCFLDGCEGEYRTHDMAEAIFESMPCFISELVWDGYQANSIFGAYSTDSIGGEWRVYLRGDKVIASGTSVDFDAAQIAARKAADDHYRGKVMSAFRNVDDEMEG